MDPVAASIIALLALCLAAVTWRGLRYDAVRRMDEHALVLALADRLKAGKVIEVAQAEAYREQAIRASEQTMASQFNISDEVEQQRGEGYGGEIGEIRAMMVHFGYDPDDDASVEKWDARFS